jgi:membrane-bound lytic murein transglycosylase A
MSVLYRRLLMQGSGRVQLPGGETLRLAHADVNGHPRCAVGRCVIDRGD